MKSMLVVCLAVGLVLGSLGMVFAAAGEDISGQAIHDRDCRGCHGSEMYRRKNLFVKDFRQLSAQVDHWLKENGIVWTEDERDEVLDYLAEEFYGFE